LDHVANDERTVIRTRSEHGWHVELQITHFDGKLYTLEQGRGPTEEDASRGALGEYF